MCACFVHITFSCTFLWIFNILVAKIMFYVDCANLHHQCLGHGYNKLWWFFPQMPWSCEDLDKHLKQLEPVIGCDKLQVAIQLVMPLSL